jgi:hypothetical protein
VPSSALASTPESLVRAASRLARLFVDAKKHPSRFRRGLADFLGPDSDVTVVFFNDGADPPDAVERHRVKSRTLCTWLRNHGGLSSLDPPSRPRCRRNCCRMTGFSIYGGAVPNGYYLYRLCFAQPSDGTFAITRLEFFSGI